MAKPFIEGSFKMNKISSIIMPFNRLQAILQMIPRAPDSISTERLQEKLLMAGFKADLRTVQYNLKALVDSEELGLKKIKVGRDSTRWQFLGNAPITVFPSLDDHTALAFQMADAFLKEFMPPETLAAMKPFVKNAEKRLSNQKQIAAARWKERIHVLPMGVRRQPPRIRPEVRDAVYSALLEDKAIRIAHARLGQKLVKDFTISPLGLVIRGYLIYLFALPKEQYERSEKQVLAFALHRIRRVEILPDERFLRPENFQLADHEHLVSRPVGRPQILRLKMRIAPEIAFSLDECPLVGRMSLTGDAADPTGEKSILSAEVPNTLELRQWLQSLGSDAEVLEPPSLRDEMAQEIKALMRRYQVN